MKRCAKCGETKTLDGFAKNRVKKDGLQTYCRPCHNHSRDQYEATDRAKLLRKKRKRIYRQRPEARIRNNLCSSKRRIATSNGSLTKEQWVTIVSIFGGRCIYCQRDVKMTMDHMHPVSLGGSLDASNIVPSCQSCNSSKNNKLLWAGWIPTCFNWPDYERWNRYCYGNHWGRIKESELVRQLCRN